MARNTHPTITVGGARMSEYLEHLDGLLDAMLDRLDCREASIDALEIRIAAARRLPHTFTHADHDAANSDGLARGEL
jgi:hypothetical protein